jgi:uncharacterized protein (DUF2062 family)
VEEVPVTCRYLEPAERVSHFLPFRDTVRGVLMHFYLTSRALAPFPKHPRWPIVAPTADARHEALGRRLLSWFSPRQAWRQLRESRVGRTDLAAGLAAGVFIANLPAYGFQSFLSLYAARRLRLHPLSVLLGSHASTPPVGPLLVAAAIAIGHFLLHGALPAVSDFDPRRAGWSAVVGPALVEWIVGGVLLGAVLATATFAIVATTMRLMGEPSATGSAKALPGDGVSTVQVHGAA